MSGATSYDDQVQAIRGANQPLLDGFEAWLRQAALAEATVTTHVENIAFFADYLVYYERLQRLDEATSGDVWMFLTDWFPRKVLWASETSAKGYLASFKKFFTWMGETGQVPLAIVADVRDLLKEERSAFLSAVRAW